MPGAVAQLGEYLSGMHENPGSISARINRCGLPSYNPSQYSGGGRRGIKVQGGLQLCIEGGVLLLLVVRQCFLIIYQFYTLMQYILIISIHCYLPSTSSSHLPPNLFPNFMFFFNLLLLLLLFTDRVKSSLGHTRLCLENEIKGLKEMSQSVKRLPCKRKNLSLIPSTHIKKSSVIACACWGGRERRTPGICWLGSLA